ncbi:Uncharacterised protein [Vibrio cholerae]|nr:Uncharacterised protein [Vibrio cholerae]
MIQTHQQISCVTRTRKQSLRQFRQSGFNIVTHTQGSQPSVIAQ